MAQLGSRSNVDLRVYLLFLSIVLNDKCGQIGLIKLVKYVLYMCTQYNQFTLLTYST